MQECYNKKLGDPEQREDYINEKCKSLVATKSSSIVKGRIMFELENCMDDGNFCNVCCVTNAGVTGGPRMSQCMDKCDEALQRKVVPGNLHLLEYVRNECEFQVEQTERSYC